MTRRDDDRVELLERTSPYQGFFRLDLYRLRHRLFAGGWSADLSREVFERGHAAAVVLYDPERDRVVLIEQFRVGAYAAGLEPWLLEAVAGIIEPGESAEAVVRREALEEAGCRIGELVPIGRVLMSPGGSSETITLYCGRVEATGADGLHGLAEEGEDIRSVTLAWDQVAARLAAGGILSAHTVIALQWLAAERPALRARWGQEPTKA